MIAVGSDSRVKEEAVRLAYPKATLIMCNVISCVPDQPVGREQTEKGAQHRAKTAKLFNPTTDTWIGIESGIEQTPNGWQDVACIVIIHRNSDKETVIWSEPLAVPSELINDSVLNGIKTWSDSKDPHSQFGSRSRAAFIAQAIQLHNIESLIAIHQDFPIKGVVFRDIFPIFLNPTTTQHVMDRLCEQVPQETNVIIGLDARGFLFGPTMALQLRKSFAPIRKQGKLPGQVVTVSYEKEYGKDVFALQEHVIQKGDKVVIVDDLLATGGTMKAACELVEKAGGQVVKCIVIIELCGMSKLSFPLYSMFTYDESLQ